MVNILQAAKWLSTGESIDLKNGKFIKSDAKEKIYRFFFKKYDRAQIEKVANFVQQKLNEAEEAAQQEYFALANAFVQCYRNDWSGNRIAKTFERNITPLRNKIVFFHKDNQKKYLKWLHYGMPSDIYRRHPEFCSFLEASGLLSQMKVTRHLPQEIEGEAALIVNGEWMKWSEIKEQFEAVYSPRYHETFILHKKTAEVYTYLDNDKGLQLHHPYITGNNPTTVLDEKEYEATWAKACEFTRPGEENLTSEERQKRNAERPFILQLVSSYVEGPETNLHELLTNPKHPYLRLIIGKGNEEKNTFKGEVYEIGYGWKNKMSIPFLTTAGQFRSPDVWSYMPCEEKIVTNMPISQQEAAMFSDYTLQYHRRDIQLGRSIAFHLAKQNCSTYARAGLLVAGIRVPTEITLSEIIARISPDWFAKVRDGLAAAKNKSVELASCVVWRLPQVMRNALTKMAELVSEVVATIMEAAAALSIAPAHVVLGGVSGEEGDAFVPPNASNRQIKPGFTSLKRWFMLSSYRFNLPGILQEWQRKQASTVIYKNPVKLPVIP